MIICDQHKFVFVHVPRTGGHSVREMWKQYDKNYRFHVTYDQGLKRFGRQHPKARNYFSFGFIRNPWERVYSLFWKHVKNSPVDTSKGFKHWMFDETRTDSQRHKQPAMYFLKGVDYVAKYEEFETEWDEIFSRIGIPRQPLPHVYKYKDKTPYQELYDDEMNEFMRQYHQVDIDYGGYEF